MFNVLRCIKIPRGSLSFPSPLQRREASLHQVCRNWWSLRCPRTVLGLRITCSRHGLLILWNTSTCLNLTKLALSHRPRSKYWCLRCGTLLCWEASISVCMPFSLAQTGSELLFPNLEGGSGGQWPFNCHSHHGLTEGFLGWKVLFCVFQQLTAFLLSYPTESCHRLSVAGSCVKGPALRLCRGKKSSPNPAYFLSCHQWCRWARYGSEYGIGESWFRTAVKGKGRVW